ncbi:MAG: hypothetical protein KDE09_16680 [Anaerolineales bacterium]|nr:hypothetical protein [Anaerolineales bacterium]MCB8961468.1 hypothetical protein [Ardenticatenales bacterium]MCB0005884.1 hypothetical protein [Anaerolineales bacterium]MCB0010840.1 hypothetical protein [Anaerolineales bacterium]MCB0019430.1 hypothetical protein [Anaerolineales bacterium]
MADQSQDMMSLFESESHSFVMRLWQEHGDSNPADSEWRGWVEHVQSGQRFYFRDFSDIKQIVGNFLEDQQERAKDQLFEPIQAPHEED